ncbi:MAG: hypothetical protein EI684_13320 [Candidatus Viridilinea halotolerans]|uniref:Transposase IS701-like DDE domain-containing protein n=1 Tax=Candidatus Viridilinea halotolerans TaxID=2491704 RepID=A0A426TXF5_9CHLR|nr:MAG: hypothetical protein EI684_13320 [Candidatus Viridilinea halotolerans]
MDDILSASARAFRDARTHELARTLAFSNILCLGRHTITATLATCGRQHVDWSSVFRLFEQERIDSVSLFAPIREAITSQLPAGRPITVVMDDTLLPKRGKSIAATKWNHDAQGPPFAHQIIWSQRVVQISAISLADTVTPSAARAIPLDTILLFQPCKPGKKAGPQAMEHYNEQRKANTANAVGRQHVGKLRAQLDKEGHGDRPLHVVIDGGYTNRNVLCPAQENIVFIGRIRKDAKIHAPAELEGPRRGRPRKYGAPLARPGELLADKSVPWRSVEVFAASRVRTFKVKTHDRCCWPSGTQGQHVRIIVVQPLEPLHDKANKRRLYFTHPGYIVCTDPELDIATVLQAYIHRWEIEVGFREQKTTLGMGQAQTRTPKACSGIIRFQSYCYAILLLAGHAAHITVPPRPKWQKQNTNNTRRVTTGELIAIVRSEMWGKAMGIENFEDFARKRPQEAKPPKIEHALIDAILCARN